MPCYRPRLGVPRDAVLIAAGAVATTTAATAEASAERSNGHVLSLLESAVRAAALAMCACRACGCVRMPSGGREERATAGTRVK